MVNLALLDFEEVALLLMASSWLLGARRCAPAKPLAPGEQFRAATGAEVAALRPESDQGLFQGRAWSQAAARAALSGGCELHGCGLWREGGLQAFLALRIERRKGLAIAFPLTDPLAQYSDLSGAGDALALLQRTVQHLAETTDVHALVLPRVRSDSALARALDQTGSIRLRESHAPYIDLSRHASHDAWLASFGAATRKSRRQRRRKLEARGEVGFRAIPAGEEAGRAARDLIDLKRSWMQANGLGSRVLDDPLWISALAGIVAAPDSRAVVSCLTLDGRLVAGEIGFVAANVYHSYLGAYDTAFARFGVGTLQIMETVRWCFEAGIATIDLLPPDDPYKREWTQDGDRHEVADHVVSVGSLGLIGASIAAGLMAGPRRPAFALLRGLGFRAT